MALLELHSRFNDGLKVVLSYDEETESLILSVDDMRTAKSFVTPVPSDQGMDAFHHPYCYEPVQVG